MAAALRDVEAATLARDGPPPITRTTFPTCRAYYPGGSSGGACRLLPRLCSLPLMAGASATSSGPLASEATRNDSPLLDDYLRLFYRRKIQDALTQLEAIVRGMEQFGSKPGSPVEECVKVVQSYKLYVGVFGMRYGSVPDGHDKSMTHIIMIYTAYVS